MTIIIIGGGTSGLTAGLTLLIHGIMNFVILESTNLFGGRMKIGEMMYEADTKSEFMKIMKEKEYVSEKRDIFWQSSMTLSNGDKISEGMISKMKNIIDSVFIGVDNDLENSFGDRLRKK